MFVCIIYISSVSLLSLEFFLSVCKKNEPVSTDKDVQSSLRKIKQAKR